MTNNPQSGAPGPGPHRIGGATLALIAANFRHRVAADPQLQIDTSNPHTTDTATIKLLQRLQAGWNRSSQPGRTEPLRPGEFERIRQHLGGALNHAGISGPPRACILTEFQFRETAIIENPPWGTP